MSKRKKRGKNKLDHTLRDRESPSQPSNAADYIAGLAGADRQADTRHLTSTATFERNPQHRSASRRRNFFRLIPLRGKHIKGIGVHHFYIQALIALTSQE